MPLPVILRTDVPGLGQVGDKKNVKDGYARNYLIPRGLAEMATPNATKKFENQKKKIEDKRMELLNQAKELAASVSKVGLVFERSVGQAGRLFGSVTHMDIAEEFIRQGARLEKKSILMDGPIRTSGTHTIRVRLHSQVIVDIPVKIVGTHIQQKGSGSFAEDVEAEKEGGEESNSESGAEEAPVAEEKKATQEPTES